MSRIRVVAARLYAAFIHAQLFVMSCRSKLTKFLLLNPMKLLPKADLADGAVHRRNSVSRGPDWPEISCETRGAGTG